MAKRKENTGIAPVYRTATEFLRGQASKIFNEVSEQDKVVVVNKNSKPQAVIISYERYEKLKYKEGADI
ncbi:type II toxin-antitoxin system prevent-host-death family antitoxin [Sporomusa sp. GT1]|uniref:type II toxin-antitoxin system prevent-host-death family antitoxin n=1 Tax=Sporomusa sp. GT1 TaxID=1534747 RepID=UPI001CB7DE9C|nr:type II toxin-antitoxin system prevent-host-death family antitoxin [Sporomusa sp. GT1]